jgi:2-iminobutanoate/2-iminopropanoate deaminase
MAKEVILSPKAPAPMPVYSHAIKANGFLFLSGQIPMDPVSGEVFKGTLGEEAARILDNLGAVLETAGATFKDVVRVTAYLTDMGDFQAFNEAYQRYFQSEPPARTTIAVAALPRGVRIEMDAIAIAP